ncbi:MAG: hypothetical protein JWQ57_4296 [Mucilaginibacter sp.]|nr:hypothetical protein [Mucilaginibacter sp.]
MANGFIYSLFHFLLILLHEEMYEPGLGRIFGIDRSSMSAIFSTLIKNPSIPKILPNPGSDNQRNQRNHNKKSPLRVTSCHFPVSMYTKEN